jgi:hypothetical protein
MLFIFLLLVSSASAPAFPAPQQVACQMLTQAQLSEATGATIGAGAPISRPGTCQWSGGGKIVTLTINELKNGKSPVDQFDAGKASTMAGVTVEPVAGVGDDAYYVYFAGTTRAGCGLVVKKGTSAFEIRVYGFELDQAKKIAKTLAVQAASKF